MSVTLYQMPHSPYAIPVRQALTAFGVPFETRDVPNWDRSEIIRLTNGAYYQVPVLVHDERIVFESSASSLDVARYVDATWAEGALFPVGHEAANLCLTEWIEDAVEGLTFKLCDIHYVPAIENLCDRTAVVRHKERRFGRGCLDAWRQDAARIRSDLDALLSRCERTLSVSPFLLGDAPVFADFALYGVLGNLCYRDWNRLSPSQTNLQRFVEAMQGWRAVG